MNKAQLDKLKSIQNEVSNQRQQHLLICGLLEDKKYYYNDQIAIEFKGKGQIIDRRIGEMIKGKEIDIIDFIWEKLNEIKIEIETKLQSLNPLDIALQLDQLKD